MSFLARHVTTYRVGKLMLQRIINDKSLGASASFSFTYSKELDISTDARRAYPTYRSEGEMCI